MHTALRAGGLLEPVDVAAVTGHRIAAQLLDAGLADPEESRYVLRGLLAEWREHTAVLRELAGSGGDELEELLRRLSTDLRDSSPE